MILLLVATLPRSMSNGNVSPAVRDVSAVTFLFTPITSPRTEAMVHLVRPECHGRQQLGM